MDFQTIDFLNNLYKRYFSKLGIQGNWGFSIHDGIVMDHEKIHDGAQMFGGFPLSCGLSQLNGYFFWTQFVFIKNGGEFLFFPG